MSNSRKIIGIILILVGIVVSSIFFYASFEGTFIFLIYGIPILIIGIVIFFNKKEDKIEQIKQAGGKNGGK